MGVESWDDQALIEQGSPLAQKPEAAPLEVEGTDVEAPGDAESLTAKPSSDTTVPEPAKEQHVPYSRFKETIDEKNFYKQQAMETQKILAQQAQILEQLRPKPEAPKPPQEPVWEEVYPDDPYLQEIGKTKWQASQMVQGVKQEFEDWKQAQQRESVAKQQAEAIIQQEIAGIRSQKEFSSLTPQEQEKVLGEVAAIGIQRPGLTLMEIYELGPKKKLLSSLQQKQLQTKRQVSTTPMGRATSAPAEPKTYRDAIEMAWEKHGFQ